MHESRDDATPTTAEVRTTKTALSGFCVCGRYETNAAKSLNYTPLHAAMNTLALDANGITKREEEESLFSFEYIF